MQKVTVLKNTINQAVTSPQGQTSYYDWEYESVAKRIYYENGRRPLPANCSHSQWALVPTGQTGYSYNGTQKWTVSPWCHFHFMTPHKPPIQWDVGLSCSEGMERILPTMATNFDFPVFIKELDDTSRLFQPWSRNPKLGLLRKAASANMWWHWGVKAFMLDLSSYAKAVGSTWDHYRALKQGRGRIHVAHFRKFLTPDTREYNDVACGLCGSGHLSRWKYDYTTRPEFNLTVAYRYDMPEYSPDVGLLYAAFDRIGFHPNLRQAWEALPLSFVVDWAVDVSGMLRNFDWSWSGINATILSYCWSFKHAGTTLLYSKVNAVGANTYQPQHKEIWRDYVRCRSLPPANYIGELDDWGLGRVSLASSLFITRLRR